MLPEIQGRAPAGRSNFTMQFNYDLNIIAIFGGKSDYGVTFEVFSDLWILSLANLTWTEVILKGLRPQARFDHSDCLVDSAIIIYGGIYNNKYAGNELIQIEMGKM